VTGEWGVTPKESVLAGQGGGLEGHWPKVWALCGLLYAWEALGRLADDEVLRVRAAAERARMALSALDRLGL